MVSILELQNCAQKKKKEDKNYSTKIVFEEEFFFCCCALTSLKCPLFLSAVREEKGFASVSKEHLFYVYAVTDHSSSRNQHKKNFDTTLYCNQNSHISSFFSSECALVRTVWW